MARGARPVTNWLQKSHRRKYGNASTASFNNRFEYLRFNQNESQLIQYYDYAIVIPRHLGLMSSIPSITIPNQKYN